MPVDHYKRLEVDSRASQAVIKASYQALIKGLDEKGQQLFKDAFIVVGDPKKRAIYDRKRNNHEGKILGQYRITEKIAEGGFGTTYKGEHVRLGTPVCIKHCPHISPEMDEILEQEARAVWDLRHYAIPVMRDMLRLEDGTSALVMSYIEGPTLEQIVQKKGQIDPEHVVWIVQRILNALQYLHYHGVVHGDIKPQNIIIQPKKHMAVLVDYGLAMVKPRANDESLGYTEVFSPPEQVKGEPLLPETDFYSLGMTALFALNNSERLVRQKKLSTKVPKPMRDLLLSLVVRDTLARPNWSKVDLIEVYEKMRLKAFRRPHSGMKQLEWP